jgi:ketol-acid reductoisomerase
MDQSQPPSTSDSPDFCGPIAVLGYGNQGHAHALNLRDSGWTVTVAGRDGSPALVRAACAGFATASIEQAVAAAELVIIALPDEVQPVIWRQAIEPHLQDGSVIGFLHGFCVHYDLITAPPDIGVVMVAPKGPGHALRWRYENGQGIPCLLAVHQDSPRNTAGPIAHAWAHGIGCGRAGIIPTTFAAEAETDLFGEQAVLCGGVTWLMRAAFETLVEAGYDPTLAYMECIQELKQVTDLVYERGIAGMMRAISNTAEFGAHVAGPKLVTDATRAVMRELLDDVRRGTFATRLMDDCQQSFPWFNEQRAQLESHPAEAAGHAVRDLLPWLREHDA